MTIGCQKIMLDAILIKVIFNLSILELRAIATPYLLDLGIKLILSPLHELLEHLLCFTFVMQKNIQVKYE
jgi:hypothetical protein